MYTIARPDSMKNLTPKTKVLYPAYVLRNKKIKCKNPFYEQKPLDDRFVENGEISLPYLIFIKTFYYVKQNFKGMMFYESCPCGLYLTSFFIYFVLWVIHKPRGQNFGYC